MPIPVEVLKRVSVVYTHAHCPDGMASAMILRDAFRMLGTSPRIEFLAHGTPEHRAAGVENYTTGDGWSLFCDIAPHPEVSGLLAQQPRTAIVLDHHKGAEEMVRSFGELGVFADEKLEPGVSGAVLAFREVWWPIFGSGEFVAKSASDCAYGPVEDFALCVGARDTWQTQDVRFHRGQWISKMLMSKPASYWLASLGVLSNSRRGDELVVHPPYFLESEIETGRVLFEQHEEAVRQAVEQVVRTFVKDGGRASTDTGFGDVEMGVSLYVFQEQASGFRLTSDVAEALRSANDEHGVVEHGVVAGFAYVVDKPGADPRLVYSLRGLGGFDVATFAKANGGGGHTAAAGFSMATRKAGGSVVMTDPYKELCDRLYQHIVAPGAGSQS